MPRSASISPSFSADAATNQIGLSATGGPIPSGTDIGYQSIDGDAVTASTGGFSSGPLRGSVPVENPKFRHEAPVDTRPLRRGLLDNGWHELPINGLRSQGAMRCSPGKWLAARLLIQRKYSRG
jgi:hypothetical protein